MKKIYTKLELTKPYLYGTHAVMHALRNSARKVRYLYVTKEALASLSEDIPNIEDIVPYKIVTKEQLNHGLDLDTLHQGVVLGTVSLPITHLEQILDNDQQSCNLIILDQVTDPHNIGAIARSAAAFGTLAIIGQDKNSPDSSSPLIAKIACGGVEHVPFISVTNLARTIETLKDHNFWIVGMDEHAPKAMDQTNLVGKIAFVMGREGQGLRRLTKELCDYLTLIPTASNFSTLNVSCATSIALYEWNRQNQ